MPETIEELRAEIERLKGKCDELTNRTKTPSSSDFSIKGVETFVMRIGPDERILHINSAFARHIGVSREDIVGQTNRHLASLTKSRTIRRDRSPGGGRFAC